MVLGLFSPTVFSILCVFFKIFVCLSVLVWRYVFLRVCLVIRALWARRGLKIGISVSVDMCFLVFVW